jgi:hypothetical protein
VINQLSARAEFVNKAIQILIGLLAATLVVFAQSVSAFQSQGWGAVVGATGDADLNDERDVAGLSGQLSVSHGAENLKFKARANAFSESLGYEKDGLLRELNLTWAHDKWEIVAGRVILPWGRADEINPTDNLSPKQLRALVSDRDEQRLGADMLRLQYFTERNWALTTIWVPKLQGSYIPQDVVRQVTDAPLVPEAEFDTYALKADFSGSGFDASISWLQSPSLLPAFYMQAPEVESTRLKQQVVGADFVWQINDRYGLRGEFAHFDLHNTSTSSPELPRDYGFYVLGLERQFADGWLAISQWVARRNQSRAMNNNLVQPLARINDAIWFQSTDDDDSVTLGINRAPFYNNFSGDLSVIYSITSGDAGINVSAIWQITSDFSLRLRHENYFGEVGTNFGALEDNRNTLVELRQGFRIF